MGGAVGAIGAISTIQGRYRWHHTRQVRLVPYKAGGPSSTAYATRLLTGVYAPCDANVNR